MGSALSLSACNSAYELSVSSRRILDLTHLFITSLNLTDRIPVKTGTSSGSETVNPHTIGIPTEETGSLAGDELFSFRIYVFDRLFTRPTIVLGMQPYFCLTQSNPEHAHKNTTIVSVYLLRRIFVERLRFLF